MNERYIKFISTIFVGLLLSADTIGQLQREGLLNYIVSSPLDTSKEFQSKKSNKIWFFDSCIIWEQRINYVTEEPTDSGRIQKYSYPVSRYVYFDLKTKHCQDYLSLTDTAKPFINYYLKESDISSPFYGFFFPKNYTYSLDTMDVIFNMTDTIIKSTSFKRVGRLRKISSDDSLRSTFYFNCKVPQTTFKFGLFAKNIAAIYPDCMIVKSESVFDASGISLGGGEYKIIQDSLTKEEKRIFHLWQKNSRQTRLPLLSYSEVLESIYPNPAHENPIITIIPRH